MTGSPGVDLRIFTRGRYWNHDLGVDPGGPGRNERETSWGYSGENKPAGKRGVCRGRT